MHKIGLIMAIGFGLALSAPATATIAAQLPIVLAQGKQTLQTAPGGQKVLRTKSNSNLSVQSVSMTNRDPAACTLFWSAAIHNSGSTTIGAGVTVQAFQSKSGGAPEPASGTSAPALRPDGTASTNPISFHRKPDKNRLEIALFQSGRRVTVKAVPLPAEPATRIDLVNAKMGSTSYSVDIRNLNPTGAPDVLIQAHAGPSASGPWSPAGGQIVNCIKGQSRFKRTGGKTASHTHVRVVVSQGGRAVATRIFSGSDGKVPNLIVQTPLLKKR